ncbi:hypothetical protein D3C72_986430 [compost metagenome]
MAQAQVFGVGEQVRVRVVIAPVEMPVLDRQRQIVGVAVAGSYERRAVVQLADPVIRRGSGFQTGIAGVVINAALIGQARNVVMDDAAVDRRHAGEDAFIKRSGQGRQFALQLIERGASCANISLQMPHGVTRDLVVEAVEHDKDDVVLHRGKNSAKQMIQVRNQSLVGASLLAMRDFHSTSMLNVRSLSRASSLPQGSPSGLPLVGYPLTAY